MVPSSVTLIHHLTIMVSSATRFWGRARYPVVATLSKGHSVDYMWRQTDARGVVRVTGQKLARI